MPVVRRALVTCALAFGLVATVAPIPAVASPAADTGWLRLAHLSPNTPAVDVYLYSFGSPSARVVLRHVSYGTVSPYLPTRPGVYTVAMRAAGAAPASAPVLSTAVRVLAGEAYTVAGMGPQAGLRLAVLSDRLTAPSGRAMIRVIQASMRQHLVTVRAGTAVLARHLAFAKATGYRAVSPGMLTVRAAGVTEHAAQQVTASAGTIHTVVVLDAGSQLKIVDLADAAGSRVIPAGAPATGLGGTAPRPSPSPVPWLAAIVAGLLFSAAGLGRLRRRPRHAALRAR